MKSMQNFIRSIQNPKYLLFGLVSLLVGLIWGYRNLKLYLKGIEVPVQVTSFRYDKRGKGKGMLPVFSYRFKGKDYSTLGINNSSTSSPNFSLGQRVLLKIDKDDPTTMLAPGFSERWLFPLSFSLVGILFLYLGRPDESIIAGRQESDAGENEERRD